MKKHIDADGFTVHEGHGEIDLSFLDAKKNSARLDNSHEDAAYAISPDIKEALRNRDAENFESLCDGVM